MLTNSEELRHGKGNALVLQPKLEKVGMIVAPRVGGPTAKAAGGRPCGSACVPSPQSRLGLISQDPLHGRAEPPAVERMPELRAGNQREKGQVMSPSCRIKVLRLGLWMVSHASHISSWMGPVTCKDWSPASVYNPGVGVLRLVGFSDIITREGEDLYLRGIWSIIAPTTPPTHTKRRT